MKIKYLGHSAFQIETEGQTILIDPFLIKYPEYKPVNLSNIFVTHGHGDHLGSAINLSRLTKSPITAIFELANYCKQNGTSAIDVGFGSWQNYNWGRAIAVPAFHSSSTPEGNYAGSPCGFVFQIEDKTIYHAGDTCLNYEMKMIGEIYKPDISMLPIGGRYTMDIEHALIASEWLQTKTVIPMHYNTFDLISIDIETFKNTFDKAGKNFRIMQIGEEI